eukprot:136146-Rhodomonas_salina.4
MQKKTNTRQFSSGPRPSANAVQPFPITSRLAAPLRKTMVLRVPLWEEKKEEKWAEVGGFQSRSEMSKCFQLQPCPPGPTSRRTSTTMLPIT